jgi:5'-3' exonuclease
MLVYEIKKYIIKELISENEAVSLSSDLEADDLIPIWINNTDRDSCIICSIDKDLRQIEGSHFDYYKVKTGKLDEYGNEIKDYRGWSYTTKQEGYDLFLKQMLIGDVSDNIKGVKGVGKVGANKIVTGSNFEKLLKVARSYKNMERMRLNVKLMRL